MLVELPVFSGSVHNPPVNYLFNTRYIRMVRPMWDYEASTLVNSFCPVNEKKEESEKFAQSHCVMFPDTGPEIIIAYPFETVAKILAGDK